MLALPARDLDRIIGGLNFWLVAFLDGSIAILAHLSVRWDYEFEAVPGKFLFSFGVSDE
jgi:hypothetical protein